MKSHGGVGGRHRPTAEVAVGEAGPYGPRAAYDRRYRGRHLAVDCLKRGGFVSADPEIQRVEDLEGVVPRGGSRVGEAEPTQIRRHLIDPGQERRDVGPVADRREALVGRAGPYIGVDAGDRHVGDAIGEGT